MQRGGAEEGGSGKSKAVCQELNLIQHSWGRPLGSDKRRGWRVKEGTNKKQRLPRGLRILDTGEELFKKKNSSIQLENIRKQGSELLNYK